MRPDEGQGRPLPVRPRCHPPPSPPPQTPERLLQEVMSQACSRAHRAQPPLLLWTMESHPVHRTLPWSCPTAAVQPAPIPGLRQSDASVFQHEMTCFKGAVRNLVLSLTANQPARDTIATAPYVRRYSVHRSHRHHRGVQRGVDLLERLGVAEVEHPAIGLGNPVPCPVHRGGHAGDRRGQGLPAQ